MHSEVTLEAPKGFLDAFNRHDLDAIMDYFHDDCVLYMPRGQGPRGDRYVGKEEVRAGLSKRFEGIPDVHYGEDTHWASSNFDASEWTLTGTTMSGDQIEVRGVDLLEFRDRKVTRKDSFWKIIDQFSCLASPVVSPALTAIDSKPVIPRKGDAGEYKLRDDVYSTGDCKLERRAEDP